MRNAQNLYVGRQATPGVGKARFQPLREPEPMLFVPKRAISVPFVELDDKRAIIADEILRIADTLYKRELSRSDP